MKRLLSFALVLVTALTAAGCNDIGTGPAGSLAGSYNMRTLGGQQLPANLYYNSQYDNIVIVSSQLSFSADGGYVDNTRIQDTVNGRTTVYSDDTEGTWTLSGSQLVLYDAYDRSNVTYATVSGGRIVIDNYGDYGKTAEYSR